ncbi:hypothetical protein GCM10010174_36750 [Kutzneria viridogrisea]
MGRGPEQVQVQRVRDERAGQLGLGGGEHLGALLGDDPDPRCGLPAGIGLVGLEVEVAQEVVLVEDHLAGARRRVNPGPHTALRHDEQVVLGQRQFGPVQAGCGAVEPPVAVALGGQPHEGVHPGLDEQFDVPVQDADPAHRRGELRNRIDDTTAHDQPPRISTIGELIVAI